MAEFFLTNKAVEDISKIWDYTFEVWSENQADKYYQLLIDSCQEISNNPNIGKNYSEISTEILGLQVGKNIILYRVMKPKEIEVVRILHGRMDLKKRIGE